MAFNRKSKTTSSAAADPVEVLDSKEQEAIIADLEKEALESEAASRRTFRMVFRFLAAIFLVIFFTSTYQVCCKLKRVFTVLFIPFVRFFRTWVLFVTLWQYFTISLSISLLNNNFEILIIYLSDSKRVLFCSKKWPWAINGFSKMLCRILAFKFFIFCRRWISLFFPILSKTSHQLYQDGLGILLSYRPFR